jgi:hypothetical protein
MNAVVHDKTDAKNRNYKRDDFNEMIKACEY